MKLLHRPTTRDEARATWAEIVVALEEMGVEHGAAFVVAAPVELEPSDQMGPFARESDTSRDAALGNYPRAGSQRWRVLEALRERGARGATRDELELMLRLGGSTVRPRVWELLHGGWIRETERTRPTRLGNEAHVLTLTDKGEVVAA